MTDLDYMRLALRLALRAKGKTSPNPIVGAVIVKSGRIIATGYHRRAGTDHAEADALKKARSKARGATLYVTLEPCSHFGRTPPCLDKIIESGIKKVVVGTVDPNPVNNGKSIRRLRAAGISVKAGFLQKELTQANEAFMKFIKYKIPFVVVKCAQTLDGKIATKTGESKWITSKKARDFTHRMRGDFDAILTGIGTVLKDNPGLNAPQKEIKKIIIDSTLKVSLNANLFKKTKPQNIFVAATKQAPKHKIEALRKKGVHVIEASAQENKVDLKWLFRELARRQITSILVEGGSKMAGALLKAKLVDKILMVLAPRIMGDEMAVSSIRGLAVKNLRETIFLKNLAVKRIGEDIFIEGYVHRNH